MTTYATEWTKQDQSWSEAVLEVVATLTAFIPDLAHDCNEDGVTGDRDCSECHNIWDQIAQGYTCDRSPLNLI